MLIDPTTLKFGGKAIQCSATGLPNAWISKVDGFEGLHLVVNLRRTDIIGKSNIPFQGETYTGLAIQGTLEIGK
ncbi:MAG: hypothetical protein JO185_19655 [Acidobacteriaceae bacterium]|nr:hypothetical protein [Acidobacteriaceae bacterium]